MELWIYLTLDLTHLGGNEIFFLLKPSMGKYPEEVLTFVMYRLGSVQGSFI